MGSGPFIGFLIGGSAVKRLTSLACFFACLSSNDMHSRGSERVEEWPSGYRNTGIISTLKYLQIQANAFRQNMLKSKRRSVGGNLNVVLYQRKTDVSFRQFHSYHPLIVLVR